MSDEIVDVVEPKPKSGGPAFPTTFATPDHEEFEFGGTGLSIRDWFAGQAPEPPQEMLDGMLHTVAKRTAKSTHEPDRLDGPEASELLAVLLAKWRYRFADAMLAERAK